jgi:hypothetical protein
LREELGALGFDPVKDPSVFVTKTKDAILCSHVDDMLCITKSAALRLETIEKLSRIFNLHDLGDINLYLGMKFTRDRANKTITLLQRRYIPDILDRFSMADAKPAKIPMQPKLQLKKHMEPSSAATQTRYQQMMGSLMYAVTGT